MEFNQGKESTLEMLGMAGIAGTVACAVQQMVWASHYIGPKPMFFTSAIILINLTLLTAYILLMKHRSRSFIVLLVGASKLFLLQAFFILSGAILWLSVLMMIFAIVAAVLVYLQELHIYMRAAENDELVFRDPEYKD